MPKYQLPQFINIEDKILGPLTIRQFLYFLAAGAILFIFWTLLKFEYFLVVAVVVLSFATMFAFVKIHGRPFHYFISSLTKFILKPQVYIWKRENQPTARFAGAPASQAKQGEKTKQDEPKAGIEEGKNLPPKIIKQSLAKKDVSEDRLKKLAWSLDTKRDDK